MHIRHTQYLYVCIYNLGVNTQWYMAMMTVPKLCVSVHSPITTMTHCHLKDVEISSSERCPHILVWFDWSGRRICRVHNTLELFRADYVHDLQGKQWAYIRGCLLTWGNLCPPLYLHDQSTFKQCQASFVMPAMEDLNQQQVLTFTEPRWKSINHWKLET